ncbi:MAG TPA: sulfotransferase domain-containing protein [Acidimicrobiales bacterium]
MSARSPNDHRTAMIHYAGYTNDLPGEIVRLAGALDITMTPDRAQELAAEATLEQMRDRADQLLPNAGAIWSDDRAFFRAGSFGEWRSRVNDDDLAEYDRTVEGMVSPELATWAHHGRIASGVDPAEV